MSRKHLIILMTLLVILIGFSIINIFVVLSNRNPEHYRHMIAEEINKASLKGIDGYTPVKGIDYFDGNDGADGTNGKDSVSTHTTETIIKQVPVNGEDGKTPIVRCNEKKNRWEQSFIGDTTWTIMFGVDNKSVKCLGL